MICLSVSYSIYASHVGYSFLALSVLVQRQEVQLCKQPDGYSMLL